jgi:hypothetical protein
MVCTPISPAFPTCVLPHSSSVSFGAIGEWQPFSSSLQEQKHTRATALPKSHDTVGVAAFLCLNWCSWGTKDINLGLEALP